MHMCLAWHNMLRETPPSLDLETVEMSFHKIYRRTTYVDIVPLPYTPAPPPLKPTALRLNPAIKLQLTKTKERLQFMVAVTEDTECVSLLSLQHLINWYVYHDQGLRCALHTLYIIHFYQPITANCRARRLITGSACCCIRISCKCRTAPPVLNQKSAASVRDIYWSSLNPIEVPLAGVRDSITIHLVAGH